MDNRTLKGRRSSAGGDNVLHGGRLSVHDKMGCRIKSMDEDGWTIRMNVAGYAEERGVFEGAGTRGDKGEGR